MEDPFKENEYSSTADLKTTEIYVGRIKEQNFKINVKYCVELYINKVEIMATSRTQFATIDEYILSFPKNIQELLEKMRQTIKQAAPDAVEAISYQMPTFKLNKKNLVHFAGFKSHIGFYPIPSGIEAFKDELSSYKQGKGSVQFPIDKPIPYDLVNKIVKFRVQENLGKIKK